MGSYGIDLTDTFFGSLSGGVGRLLKFCGVCWGASLFGAFCTLNPDWWGYSLSNLLLWPFVWAISVGYACFVHWWFGIPYLIYLLANFLSVVWNDGSTRRGLMLLFILQSWHTWCLSALGGGIKFDVDYFFSSHAFFWLLTLVSAVLGCIVFKSNPVAK